MVPKSLAQVYSFSPQIEPDPGTTLGVSVHAATFKKLATKLSSISKNAR